MKALKLLTYVTIALACVLAVTGEGSRIRVSRTGKVKHGYVFIDASGRARLFHGVNAVYKIPPWRPQLSGFDHRYSLSEEDAKLLRAWGFNVVRLGVMWPGVEPQRQMFDQQYLADITTLVNTLGRYGIYTIIDLHQDLGNRAFCGEGIPDWAAYKPDLGERAFPWPVRNETMPLDDDGYPQLSECLKVTFSTYYTTKAVQAEFQGLYDNKNGAGDEFCNFWYEVARTFAGNDNVLGYELINEPFTGDTYESPELLIPGVADKRNLWPLYQRAHNAIRRVDNETIIFFERTTLNVVGTGGLPSGPGGAAYNDRQAYSYHNYCGTVDRSGNPVDTRLCEAQQQVQWDTDMADIDKLGCGSFITEFGAVSGNNSKSIKNLEWLLRKADEQIQSWAYWQYKSYNDITTASNEKESFFWADGALQEDKVATLVRPYAQAIAGVPTYHRFDTAKKAFTLKFVTDGALAEVAPTEIFVGSIPKHSVQISPAGAASCNENNGILYVYHTKYFSNQTLTVEVVASN